MISKFSKSPRLVAAVTLLVTLGSQGAHAQEADAGVCIAPPTATAPIQLNEALPNFNGLNLPFLNQNTQNDRLLQRADECSRRFAKDPVAGERMIETYDVTASRVTGTGLEPFTAEINLAIGANGSDSVAYAKVARYLGESRLIAAYERFAGQPMNMLPPACKGKLDRGFAKIQARGATVQKDPNFSEKFQIAAQHLQALMTEQYYYRGVVEQRKAAKDGRGVGCDVFMMGTLAKPYCPEDRLRELEETIEGYYSAFPQFGMGRDLKKPAYEDAPKMAKIVGMNLNEVEDYLKNANYYVAEKIDAALNKLCAEPSFGGMSDREVLAMPGVRNAGLWNDKFPQLKHTRYCVNAELKDERQLLARNERDMAYACAGIDFVTLGLASPICAGATAYGHLQDATKKLTWLSKCRAGGDALCVGSEAVDAQHLHEESRQKLKEAGVDLGISAVTAAVTLGAVKMGMPKVPTGAAALEKPPVRVAALEKPSTGAIAVEKAPVVKPVVPAVEAAVGKTKLPTSLADRLTKGIANLSSKKPELAARLTALEKTLTPSEISAIEEAHKLPNSDLAGKVAILRQKAPRLTMADRRALIEGWVCGENETTETIIWGKIDCDGCGAKAQSAKPDVKTGQATCTNCGKILDTSKAYLDAPVDETGKVHAAEADIAKAPEEIKMAKGGADWSCPYCRTPNKAVKKVCSNCGADKGGAPKPEVKVTSTDAPSVEPAKSGISPGLVIGGGAGIAAIVGTTMYLHDKAEKEKAAELERQKPRDVAGEVTTAHWIRTSQLERFTALSPREWKFKIPTEASVLPHDGAGAVIGSKNIRNCKSEFYQNEQYVCGSEQVCQQVPYEVPDGQSCHDEPYQSREGQDCRQEPYQEAAGQDCRSVPRTSYDSVPDGQDCRQSCRTVNNRNGSFSNSCSTSCTPRYRSVSRTTYSQECSTRYRTAYKQVCTDRYVTRYRQVCVPKTKTVYRTECHQEPKYCTRPIYQERCDYDTYAWQPLPAVVKEGDLTKKTPDFTLPDRKELGLDDMTRVSSVRDEFDVEFDFTTPTGKKLHRKVDTSSASDFKQWYRGQKPTVTSNMKDEFLGVKPN